MSEQTNINPSNFISDFETTLAALDAALTDAVHAVSSIRTFVPQIAALAQVVTTIESAVTQARQNMDAAPAAPAAAPAPPLATSAEPMGLRAVEPAAQVVDIAPEEPEEIKPTSSASQCVRLTVTKSSGALDLKTVDNALNEHPEIVDLALLDYDGRQATLKVWVSGSTERQGLQESLTADLLERVGEGAEVKIEFDQESAAA